MAKRRKFDEELAKAKRDGAREGYALAYLESGPRAKDEGERLAFEAYANARAEQRFP